MCKFTLCYYDLKGFWVCHSRIWMVHIQWYKYLQTQWEGNFAEKNEIIKFTYECDTCTNSIISQSHTYFNMSVYFRPHSMAHKNNIPVVLTHFLLNVYSVKVYLGDLYKDQYWLIMQPVIYSLPNSIPYLKGSLIFSCFA